DRAVSGEHARAVADNHLAGRTAPANRQEARIGPDRGSAARHDHAARAGQIAENGLDLTKLTPGNNVRTARHRPSGGQVGDVSDDKVGVRLEEGPLERGQIAEVEVEYRIGEG